MIYPKNILEINSRGEIYLLAATDEDKNKVKINYAYNQRVWHLHRVIDNLAIYRCKDVYILVEKDEDDFFNLMQVDNPDDFLFS